MKLFYKKGDIATIILLLTFGVTVIGAIIGTIRSRIQSTTSSQAVSAPLNEGYKTTKGISPTPVFYEARGAQADVYKKQQDGTWKKVDFESLAVAQSHTFKRVTKNIPAKVWVSRQAVAESGQRTASDFFKFTKQYVDDFEVAIDKQWNIEMPQTVTEFDERTDTGCRGATGGYYYPAEICTLGADLQIIFTSQNLHSGASANLNGVKISANYIVGSGQGLRMILHHELGHVFGFYRGHYNDIYSVQFNNVNNKIYNSPYIYTDIMGLGTQTFQEHSKEVMKRLGGYLTSGFIQSVGPNPDDVPQYATLTYENQPMRDVKFWIFPTESTQQHTGSAIKTESLLLSQTRTDAKGQVAIPNQNSSFVSLVRVYDHTKNYYYGWMDTSVGNLAQWKKREWVVVMRPETDPPPIYGTVNPAIEQGWTANFAVHLLQKENQSIIMSKYFSNINQNDRLPFEFSNGINGLQLDANTEYYISVEGTGHLQGESRSQPSTIYYTYCPGRVDSYGCLVRPVTSALYIYAEFN